MLPYRDNLVAGGQAWAVLALIALLSLINLPLFLFESWHTVAIQTFGFTPLNFSLHPLIESYTLITSAALHGDFFHLAGNCLFLVVFGRTLERLFGSALLLAIFPALGIAGILLHWAVFPNAAVPVIGASGAIAALMGAYLPLFPQARIRVIVFLGWFWKRFTVPAWAFLPYWGGLQFVSLALGSQDGVAYAVHAGSFAAGVLGAIAWKTSYPFAEEKLAEFTCTSFQDSLTPASDEKQEGSIMKALLSALKIIVIVLAAAAAAGIGKDIAGGGCSRSPSSAQQNEEKLIEGLKIGAAQSNSRGPVMLDQDTRLDGMTVGPGARVTAFYSLINFSSREVAPDWIRSNIRPTVRSSVCASSQTKPALQYGAAYAYVYRGNDGAEIARFEITQNDCY